MDCSGAFAANLAHRPLPLPTYRIIDPENVAKNQ
jgi:hypothetical protein